MTDYEHFPRIPRRSLSTRDTNKLFVLLVILLILGSLSFAGREDMKAQATVDKHLLLHEARRAVSADERAALYFYQERHK